MAASSHLLDRLLKTVDLAKVVPHLSPELIHRVIQTCGLEDSVEFVALATPAQLSRVLDVDVWQGRTPGGDDQFDVDRFGVWLEVLMQSGAAVAANTLIDLDLALVVTGFSRHVVVSDLAAVSAFTTLDGRYVERRESNRVRATEIAGYAFEARRESAWEAVVDLLTHLAAEHPEYFDGLMRRCVGLSNGPREADGFHSLLEDTDQDMFDLASARGARREREGYVTPAQARAFMQSARDIPLDTERPPDRPLARAYFGEMSATADTHEQSPDDLPGLSPESRHDETPAVSPAVIAEVVDVLRDAGLFTPEPRGLLEAAGDDAARLAFVRDHVAGNTAGSAELAYLANVIVAGCAIQARPFTPQEASTAAAAICNLGLEAWPQQWTSPDLIAAFQVGWTTLHRDVSMYVAERLMRVVAGLKCPDRDIQIRLHGLHRVLARSIRDGTPWRARDALEVVVMIDGPCWAALVALTDECPVLHAAMRPTGSRALAINLSDYEFISQRSHIAMVREFIESLTARLTL